MSLSVVQTQPVRPAPPQDSRKALGSDPERLVGVAIESTSRTENRGPLGGIRPESLQAQSLILERLGPRFDARSVAAKNVAVGAERSESRESVAVLAPGEETPEALAGRIVEGIAEFIMGSWRSRHPDMEEADVLRFQNQVMRGFELGLNDTKDILTGLGVFTPVVADSLERTEGLAREQLAEVFETTLKSVRGSRPADLPSPL